MTAVELTDCPPRAPELPRGLAAASAICRIEEIRKAACAGSKQ